jgi:hypothetical protein
MTSVNIVFRSQWIPHLTHELWKCETPEVFFATVQRPRFVKVLNWVAVPITIKHSEVWGVPACSELLRILSEQRIWCWILRRGNALHSKWPLFENITITE